MKYFLAEIYITHRKVFFGYIAFTAHFTSILVEAENWEIASEKTKTWATNRMEEFGKTYKYKHFTTPTI